jgi:hypothetical protein
MSAVQEKLAGRFAYKFGGHAIASGNDYLLKGVGYFTLAKDGTLTGHHRFSLLLLANTDELITGGYELAGSITMSDDGTGSAAITFTPDPGTTTDGSNAKFHVVMGGDYNNLWFVSAGGTRAGSNAPTTELTLLEAVRATSP